MNDPKVIENSLFWQRHILASSNNPKQIERAMKAIQKLKAQLEAIKEK